jgi:formylglycine-generating enzyme required for sulfatase activity
LRSAMVSTDHNLRQRVVKLIPELEIEKSAPFIPLLTKILDDPHAKVSLRVQSALVLAKITRIADGELWRALQNARNENDQALRSSATWASCELGRFEELGLLKVPAGEFLMGSADTDRQADGDEKPQHTLYLPTYYIGKYPVTVDAYRSFVQESKYETSHKASLKGTGNHPVVDVSWKDALAFARLQGMALPSEAEWEKAARGTDGRIYPWGNVWRSGLANTSEYWSARGWWTRLRRMKTVLTTTPVGYFSPRGDSPYDCADMSGNVWEWTRSIRKEYPYDANDGREAENVSGRRVLRGGSFLDNQRLARCAVRGDRVVDNLFNDVGFRVVASSFSPESS